MTTAIDEDFLTALTQTRLTDMPGHIACAVRQAMYADGYLQAHGDGDIKTFSPFDGMEDDFAWQREAYIRAALETLTEQKNHSYRIVDAPTLSDAELDALETAESQPGRLCHQIRPETLGYQRCTRLTAHTGPHLPQDGKAWETVTA